MPRAVPLTKKPRLQAVGVAYALFMSSNTLFAYMNPPVFSLALPTSSVRFPGALSLSTLFISTFYDMPVGTRFILLLAFVRSSALRAAIPLDSRRISDTVA